MNDKQIQEAFILFLALKSGAKTQQELEKYVQSLGEDGLKQAYQEFTLVMLKQAQKAAHGAKLQYLRNLKHQCAEDEELVYYKKGGSLDCGCVKKKEDGGEVVKANTGVVANFKEDLKKKKQQLQKLKWTNIKDNELKKLSEKKTLTPLEKQRLQQLRNEFKNSSNTRDYEVEEGKKGMKVEKDCGGSAVIAKFKAKCGVKMKKHEQGGLIQIGKEGLRFSFSYQDKNGKYVTKEFNTKQEAEIFRKKSGKVGKITDYGENRADVIRTDNVKSGKYLYKRNQVEKYNNLSFKDAYKAALKEGTRWFGYKGKVYDSGLRGSQIKNDNLTNLMKIYGNNLGWSDNKNFNNKQSINARKDFRSKVITTKEKKSELPKSNGMGEIAKNFSAAKFVDTILPTNAIGNFIGMGVNALTGNLYVPETYVSGFNPFGYAEDLANGNVKNLALRGLDTYTSLGMPGASEAIDLVGTRVAPNIGILGSKSAYIPKGGTEKVIDEAGNVVGRTLNRWNWNSLAPWRLPGGTEVKVFGRRSILRAANEGVLDLFAFNNGMNNVTKYATTAVKNPNTGTTFFFKNSAVHPYDAVIDRAMQIAPYWGYGSNQVIQQVTE